MPRRGKGSKRKWKPETSLPRKLTGSLTATATKQEIKKLSEIDAMAREAKMLADREFVRLLLRVAKRVVRKENKKNVRVLKAPSHGELPLGQFVALGEDGYLRWPRENDKPIGKVVHRSQRVIRGKVAYYASVAQDVERPVEARKVAGSHQPGAPKSIELYGGGSRELRRGETPIELLRERERGRAEGDLVGAEYEGVPLRSADWQREGGVPSWLDA